MRSATLQLRGFLAAVPVSIHALLAECDIYNGEQPSNGPVSIHALLAECDRPGSVLVEGVNSFNPRTPCGVRPKNSSTSAREKMFQSTHSLRSATPTASPYPTSSTGFNPRTPCGVRRLNPVPPSCCLLFQSTHSLRSATVQRIKKYPQRPVSIHALLAECDAGLPGPGSGKICFNPRTPCGVRRIPPCGPASRPQFQSTHSLRSATLPAPRDRHPRGVSIHALLAECDLQHLQSARRPFNVSIHALLAECDTKHCLVAQEKKCFNPRTPCGVRLRCWIP